ncbi:MAG: BglG family transcription antiterminator [Erysipelotrichaceae bacterium]
MELYNKRIIKILQLFVKNKKILSSDQIALSLSVSSRTIRSDIKNLEAMLKTNGAHIKSEIGLGYHLVVTNPEAFQTFLDNVTLNNETSTIKDNVVPSDPQDRAMYIIHRLLMVTLEKDKEKIDPFDLGDELFISMSTLKKDMKTIDKILKRFSLKILMNQNKGVHIEGEEENIRYCISEFIFNQTNLTTMEDSDFYEDIFPLKDTNIIKTILLSAMEHYQIRLTDIAFKNLLVHIVIMLKRSSDQQRVDYDEANIKILMESIEFNAAKEIVSGIKNMLEIDLEDEVYYLTQHLISSKKFLTVDFKDNEDDFEFKKSIKIILDEINRDTGVDLSNDIQLINGLAVHLNVALHRMRFNMNIRNGILDQIKNAYPFAFELAVKASEIIERIFAIKTNENEIGFLAVHFGAALERVGLNEKSHSLNAVIVCASGMATAMLLKEKIKQHFQNQIHIVKTCPLYELNQSLIDEVDLVLATIPIENFKSNKIIFINVLLNTKDIKEVEKAMNKNQNKYGFQLKNIFKKDLFLTDLKANSREDVLEQITNYMMKKHYMDEITKLSVFKREEMATTELGSMVAMPHALENVKGEPNVAIAVLDKPIIWDKEKVQVVLLLNIPKSEYGMWEIVFKSLYTYLIADYGVQKLMKGCSYEEFITDLEYQNNK